MAERSVSNQVDDLEAEGLIAHSYDALFAVRKRVRKINDLHLPTRRGLDTQQIFAFVVVFIAAVVVVAGVIVPAMNLLHLPRPWWVTIALLIGPPVLAAQRISKPMAYGKSIPGSLTSALRFHVADNPVHRRGLPVPSRRVDPEQPRLHYQREWVPTADASAGDPSEAPWTDAQTEARFSGEVVDLQDWMDDRAYASREAEDARIAARYHDDDDLPGYARDHQKGGAA